MVNSFYRRKGGDLYCFVKRFRSDGSVKFLCLCFCFSISLRREMNRQNNMPDRLLHPSNEHECDGLLPYKQVPS